MDLDIASLFSYFVVGTGGGFILYVVISLLGFGIGKFLKMIN